MGRLAAPAEDGTKFDSFWTEYAHPNTPGDGSAAIPEPNATGNYHGEWFMASRLTYRVFRRPANP